ncbi:F-box/FBD/LRR-repeat protein At1g13570 [Linum grandiflorum]
MKRLGDSTDVLEQILTLLPIKDAARTSILSREWRHRWRSISQLVFDRNFALLKRFGDGEKVMLKVYQALLAHDGPITKFELAIPGMRRRRYIDLLMLYLSRRDVQELILLFEGRDCPLHSSLFSAFHHLRSLKLGNCEFSPPSPLVGFGKLNFLELENIILPAGFYDHFLVACPLLEELRVLDCYDHDDDEEQEHQFVSPSLKVLLFRSEIGKLCFRHTPLLSVLSVSDTADFEFDFDDVNDQWKLDMVALFGSLPSLEQLHLGGALLILLAADVHVPRQLPTLLHQLRVIEIPHMSLNNLSHVRVLVCLIMSSPNLQQLTIGVGFRLNRNLSCLM